MSGEAKADQAAKEKAKAAMAALEEEIETQNCIEPLRLLFGRVYARGENKNRAWLDIWCLAFKIEKTDPKFYSILSLVSDGVEATIRRINNATEFQRQTKAMSVSIISQCAEFLKPVHLMSPIGGNRELFNPDKMNVLLIAGEAMQARYEEPRMSTQQRQGLIHLVEEMEKIIGSGKLHPILSAAIEPHVKMIRWAILNYEIVGIDGLMRSCTETWLDLRRADGETMNEAAEELGEKFGTLWKWVDRADKLCKLVDRGHRLLESLGDLPSIGS